jgi:hypothetical protein
MFYSGDLMRPEAIRDAFPNALFIARASVPVSAGPVAERFAAVVGDEVWGIAVETGAKSGGTEIQVVTDDGRQLPVVLAEPLLGGNPVQVLANARYWELPPDYVNAISAVVPIGGDEE